MKRRQTHLLPKTGAGLLARELRPVFVATFLVGFLSASSVWSSPSISWSGTQNVSIPIAPFGTITTPFDLDGNGVIDYEFFSPMNDLYFTSQAGNSSMVTPGLGLMPLDSGTWIGTTPDASFVWTSASELVVSYREPLADPSDCSGPWCNTTNGYIGLEFLIDGSVHYGWARMSVGVPGLTMTLHDWAYETEPGVGLNAGVVPEPSTIILLSAGALVAAFGWWRRQR